MLMGIAMWMDDHKNSSIGVYLSQGTNDWVGGQTLQESLCFAHDGTFTPSDLQLANVGLVSLTSSWGLCLPIRPVSYGACMSGVSTEGHRLHRGCLPLSHPHHPWPPLPLHAGPSHLLWACADGEGADSPSNSPSGSARRAAGRRVGLHTSPAAPWRHCGSWQGSVSAAGGEETT